MQQYQQINDWRRNRKKDEIVNKVLCTQETKSDLLFSNKRC